MSEQVKNLTAAFISEVAAGTLLMCVLTLLIDCKEVRDLKREAIEHNAAHYDPQTGERRWKESEVRSE